jgi:DNA-binding CsgD family transcriptional regulator
MHSPEVPRPCLTVLAEDGEKLDRFREVLAEEPRVRVAERLQSGGADLAWSLSLRPVVQVLKLHLCPAAAAAAGPVITGRELEVLRLLAQDCSYFEAGVRLGVSANTVSSHIKSAYRKLEVHSAAAAVMQAVRLRLIWD